MRITKTILASSIAAIATPFTPAFAQTADEVVSAEKITVTARRQTERLVDVPASVTELQRIGLFGSLPGETITKLAAGMVREEFPGGRRIVAESDHTDRFYVLLSGLAGITQEGRGARGVLRPGETFGEVAALLGIERTATVTAMTTCVVASCDRETFTELLRPLYADDGPP